MLIAFFEWKKEMGREEEERENIPWKMQKICKNVDEILCFQ